MSRVAKAPVSLPKGVSVTVSGQEVSAKGPKGTESLVLHDSVTIDQEDTELRVRPVAETRDGFKMAGTMRSLVNNLRSARPSPTREKVSVTRTNKSS